MALRPSALLLLVSLLLGASIPALRADALSDALDTTDLTWTTSGDAVWFSQTGTTHDGADAVQAGAVGYAQHSMLSAPVTGPGTLVFWASVETGAGATELSVGYDGGTYLSLYEQTPSIGRGWHAYAVDVPAGNHELNFNWLSYASDPTAPQTQHAWVDQVSFANYSGQKPAFVVEPADVELLDEYPWSMGVALTGETPFAVTLQRTGLTYNYPQQNRSEIVLGLDRVTSSFAGMWELIANNSHGAVTSRTFSVTVKPSPPLIRRGPYDADLSLGSLLEVNVSAVGTAPLVYQWRHDGTNLPAQTSSTLSLPATISTDAGPYQLVVTNLYGAATSRVAQVTLSTNPPSINQQSQGLTVLPGDSAYFWVDCAGSSPLHYQWQKNAGDVAGATNSELWIASATPADAGNYRVVVTNLFGSVTSDTVTLAVVDPIAEAVDAPELVFHVDDYLTGWTVVTDVTHNGQDAARSFPVDDSGFSGVKTALTGPGTLTFWWKVSSETSQDVLELIVDDTTQTNISGEVDWQQQSLELGPGTYDVLWRYTKDGSGSVGEDAAWLDQVVWTPQPPVTFPEALDAPSLVFETGAPSPWQTQLVTSHDGMDAGQSGATVYGETSSLSVTLIGAGRLSFWSRTSSANNDRLSFYLDGVLLDGGGGQTDWQQRTFPIGAGTHTFSWAYENNDPNTVGSDTAWLDEVVWLPHDLEDALDAPGLQFNVDDTYPWFRQTTVTHDGVDAAQSTVPAVGAENWMTTTLNGPGTLAFWGKLSAGPSDTLRFKLDWSDMAILYGESDWTQFTYEIGAGSHVVAWRFRKADEQVTGLNTAFVDEITFSPRTAPTIAVPPQSARLLKGGEFTLSVSAVGDPPLAYQWLRNGTNLPGEINTNLVRLAAQYGDSGDYSVMVTNLQGATSSSAARVAVVPMYYRIQELGTLGTNLAASEAFDVNNFGEVVGRANINEWKSYGNRLYHGFAWTPGSGMFDLGDGRITVNVDSTNRLPGYSCAYALNDSFDIVGYYEYRVNSTQDGYGHATYWRQLNCSLPAPVMPWSHCPVEMIDVHPRDIFPPDTQAVAVNSRRQMLLQGGNVWVLTHYGYVTEPSIAGDRFSPFKTRFLGGGSGGLDPYALNSAGHVVGRYREFIGGDAPYLDDGLRLIGSDAITNSFPVAGTKQHFKAINDRGVIAGLYSTNSPEGWVMRHAFVQHPDGRIELLPDPFHDLYEIKDINNRNQVVGSDYAGRGVLCTDGYWFLLNDLLRDNDGVDIDTANAINDRGQIVGQAGFRGLGSRAYLLTPDVSGNHDPVAVADTLILQPATPVWIPASTLLANDSDPDLDPIRLDWVFGTGGDDLTEAGGQIRREGSALRYTPPPAIASNDTFFYSITDGRGDSASALVTITLSPAAPAPIPLMNAPEVLADGNVRLSGRAPAGSTILIYRTVNLNRPQWVRDWTLTVLDSNEWSVTRPGQIDGQRVFYRPETSGQP